MKVLIILWLCFAVCYPSYTQTNTPDTLLAKKLLAEAIEAQQQGAYATSTQKLEEVLTIYAQAKRWDDYLLNKTQIIRNYWRGGQPDTALVLCQEILADDHFEPKSLIAAEVYSNLGVIHDKKGLFPEALEYYKQCLAIRKEQLGNEHIETGKIYFNLGACYILKKEYSKGIEYFEYTLQNFQQSLPKKHPYFLSVYKNIALAYQKLHDFNQALININLAIRIGKEIYPADHFQILQLKKDKIAIYSLMPIPKQEIIDLYLEILPPLTRIYGETHYQIVGDYLNLHNLYSKMEGPKASVYLQESTYYLNKAKKILEEHYSSKSMQYTTLYDYTANVYANKRDLESELEFRHKMALTLLPDLADDYPLDRPIDYENVNVSDIKELSRVIAMKINILFLLKKKESGKKYTELYQQSLRDGKIIINRIKKDIPRLDDQIEILLKKRTYLNYKIIDYLEETAKEKAENALQDIAIDFDQCKSMLLQAALSSNNALKFGNIPDSLRDQELALKKSINQVKEKINKPSSNRTTTALAADKKKLFELNEKYSELGKTLETQYSNYFKLKYDQAYPSIAELQKELLDEKTILFNYLLEDSSLVIFRITSSALFLNKISIDDNFFAQLTALKKSLEDTKYIYDNPQKSYDSFVENSYALYEKLLKDYLPEGIENLIIIPDKELGQLPFEVLLTSPQLGQAQNYKVLPYLLKKYSVRYAYSAALLLENQNQNKSKTTKSNKIVGFAASYNPSLATGKIRKVLVDLPGAVAEVQQLQKSFEGDFFIKDQANEATFNQVDFSKYSVLHLALHGIMDKTNPMNSSLALTADSTTLEDDFIYAYELINKSIPTNLVVLSACETGGGKIQTVEGIMSLGRSFMYAGTPSIIMSLWQINDFSTVQVMKLFYTYLAQGMPKDEALRKAKLDYIELAKDLAAHPAFWAPFIQLGDASPIELKKKRTLSAYLPFILSGLLLLLTIGYYLKKKKE